MTRQLHLNAFIMSTGHHEASWRLPESNPAASSDVSHFQNLARIAEAGKLDSIFFADAPVLMSNPARRPAETLDPVLLLTAIAAVTERIGLIATSSTTFNEPYNLARSFASLDQISGGRAGWNVVTTISQEAAFNFSLDAHPQPEDRYRRAHEFLDVTLGLWDSWADDAVLADKATGVYADPEKVHRLDYEGEFFKVRGPLNVARSPQGSPVIVQAGSSGPGIELAAAFAEAVFTAQTTLEDGQAFYSKLKAATLRAGRDPESLKILPGIVTVIGGTEEEARRLDRQLDDLIVLEHPHQQLAEDVGLPVSELDLDAPLPTNIRPVEEVRSSRYELTVNLARRENLTVRELLIRLGGGRGHRTFAGTPEQVANTIEEWFTHGASDGFNIMPAVMPSGLEDFVDQVVPILQDRGLFRREYEGTTLRDHLGLAIPAGRGAASLAEVG
jgi:FMN-dependent oxidoreductase (nitrilotriacetate monooxygenase family)